MGTTFFLHCHTCIPAQSKQKKSTKVQTNVLLLEYNVTPWKNSRTLLLKQPVNDIIGCMQPLIGQFISRRVPDWLELAKAVPL